MSSMFRQVRDAEGREVVEIGMNPNAMRLRAIVPLLLAPAIAYFAVNWGPEGMPWYIYAVPIAFGLISYPLINLFCSLRKLRVTMDRKAGKLQVSMAGSTSDVRMADAAKAEFAAGTDSQGQNAYRLEFVMKNGERVPVMAAHTTGYSSADKAQMLAAINAVLGAQMV